MRERVAASVSSRTGEGGGSQSPRPPTPSARAPPSPAVRERGFTPHHLARSAATTQSRAGVPPLDRDCFAPLAMTNRTNEPTTADLEARRAARLYPDRPIIAVLAVVLRGEG